MLYLCEKGEVSVFLFVIIIIFFFFFLDHDM